MKVIFTKASQSKTFDHKNSPIFPRHFFDLVLPPPLFPDLYTISQHIQVSRNSRKSGNPTHALSYITVVYTAGKFAQHAVIMMVITEIGGPNRLALELSR